MLGLSRLPRSVPSRIALTSLVAVSSVFVATRVASASHADAKPAVIHGCVGKTTHVLRVINPAHTQCLTTEYSISWNKSGVQGPQGPTGPRVHAGNGDRRASWARQVPRGRLGPQVLRGRKVHRVLQGPQGVAGFPGQPGPAGPAGMTWRGGWSQAVVYAKNDAVQYLGSSWIAVAANQFVAPGTNSNYWHLLAAAGSPGPQGPQGARGAQGAPGLPGAAAPRYFASVNGSGSVDHAIGVASVSHPSAGTYVVTFNADVAACAYAATLGAAHGAFAIGFISTTRDAVQTHAVDVRTVAPDGTTSTDMPFFLTVAC